ncbi:hypothetical protein OWV82_023240, partial [Melia azedarach]
LSCALQFPNNQRISLLQLTNQESLLSPTNHRIVGFRFSCGRCLIEFLAVFRVGFFSYSSVCCGSILFRFGFVAVRFVAVRFSESFVFGFFFLKFFFFGLKRKKKSFMDMAKITAAVNGWL